MDESKGNGEGKLYGFGWFTDEKKLGINFLTSGELAGTFSWKDIRTLNQIEQMTGYTVKPQGVVSKYKQGGFVFREENGHGLVLAIIDLVEMYWYDAKIACDELESNGYDDWHLPTKDELNTLYVNLIQEPVRVRYYTSRGFWSSTFSDKRYAWFQNFDSGFQEDVPINGSYGSSYRFNVRAVRTF